MHFANEILGCLCNLTAAPPYPQSTQPSYHQIITEKPPLQSIPNPCGPREIPDEAELDALTARIIAILIRAEKPGVALTQRLDDAVSTTGWSEWMAERVLKCLEETLKGSREVWGEALSDAYGKTVEIAEEVFEELWDYVKEHPAEVAASVLLTLVTFGVLARLMPWILELLGFAAQGPVEGSFAAWFQSTYRGSVPKGSIMSFLQRLGMTWERK